MDNRATTQRIRVIGNILCLMSFFLFLAACGQKAVEIAVPESKAHKTLTEIDSLMWQHPDSALTMLMEYKGDTEVFNNHYAQLLTSELLYKNDYEQTNRAALQRAVVYFDSLIGGDNMHFISIAPTISFLAARAHYINGVGYYEHDSLVPACTEYLKALEVMEGHFKERKLVENKAKFMALTHMHLSILYSNQYLHEQAIYFGQLSFLYFQKYDAYPWHKAWVLNEIGSNYNMMERLDSADYYYRKAIDNLGDTTTMMHRDLAAHLAYLDYQRDSHQTNSAKKRLYYLISIAENEQERIIRCSYLGEILFHEKQFDSAWICLKHVFQKTSNIGTKKQVAERLVTICQIYNKDAEMLEYASFLAPFANMEENKSEIKSQLTELYKEFGQRKLELKHQKEVKKHIKRAFEIILGLAIVTLITAFLYHKNKRHKKYLETLIESERQTHKMQQAALAGRLKRSNAALKERDIVKHESDDSSFSNQQNCIIHSYEEEPICQHILSLCNDKKNPIKSTVPVSAYANIALDDTQKAQLKAAALQHYGKLFDDLKRQHPELKEKDFFYCYLCILGLDNIQIAVMLQHSNSTIWERENRLKRILGTNGRISVILHGYMTS